jgi:hypothetical protein
MFSLSSMMPQGSLPELAESVRRALGSVQAQIAAAWTAQHRDDGSHGNVTATSLSVQHFRMAGSIMVIDASVPNIGIGDPLLVPAGVQFVSIKTPNVGGTVVIKGIQQPGVRYGDWLYLRRDPTGVDDIEIEDSATSVPFNTYIHVPQEVSASWPAFFIQRPCWLPLIYAPNVGSAPPGAAAQSDGWVIPQWVSL